MVLKEEEKGVMEKGRIEMLLDTSRNDDLL